MDKLIVKRASAFLFDGLLVAAMILWLPGRFWALVGIGYLLLRDALIGGRSIGKFIVGVTVMDHHKNACGILRSVVRNLCLFLPGPVIELLVMAFSAGGRRLGDRLAQTQVIDTRPEIRGVWFLLLALSLTFLLTDPVRSARKVWGHWEHAHTWREVVQSERIELETRLNPVYEYFGWESHPRQMGSARKTARYVIHLRDGRTIEAEEYWETGTRINFRRLGGIVGVARSKVAMIENTADGTRTQYHPSVRTRP